jgi:hypothetical protein
MVMKLLQIIIGSAILLVASPAVAKDSGQARWTVTQTSGDVRVVRNGLQPASLQVRASLAPGDVVATGATGRVVLVRGGDYVVVAPGSRLLLPKQETSGFTRLLQQVGTMLYKVQHTGVPHFEVKTPLLAAVVKGTSFTVVVDDKRAAVQVTDGLVEVSSADGAARQLVEKGVTVYVGYERPGAIVTVGPQTKIEATPGSDSVKVESSAEVTVAAIADLSAGLVTAKTVAPMVETDRKAEAGGLTVATPVAHVKDVGDAKGGVLVTPVGGIIDAVDVTKPVVQSPGIPVLDVVTTSPVVPAPAAPVIDLVVTTPVVTAPVLTTPIVTTTPVAVTAPVVTTAPIIVTAPIIATTPVVVTTPTVTTAPVVTTTPIVPIVPVVDPVVQPVTAVLGL